MYFIQMKSCSFYIYTLHSKMCKWDISMSTHKSLWVHYSYVMQRDYQNENSLHHCLLCTDVSAEGQEVNHFDQGITDFSPTMKIAELAFVIFFSLNTLVFAPWIQPRHHHLDSSDSLHLLKPAASSFDASSSPNSDQPRFSISVAKGDRQRAYASSHLI